MGHTHKDIDAFFGVYSKYLAQVDVFTVEGMCLLIEFSCDRRLHGGNCKLLFKRQIKTLITTM